MPIKQDAGLRLGFQAAPVKACRSRIKLCFDVRNLPKAKESGQIRGIDAQGSRSEKFAHYFSGLCEAELVKQPGKTADEGRTDGMKGAGQKSSILSEGWPISCRIWAGI